jgi:hypothetical protein
MPDNAKFCVNCGCPLQPSQPAPNVGGAAPKPNRMSASKKFLIPVVCVIAAVLFSVIASVNFKQPK